jgi:hypothetical protein
MDDTVGCVIKEISHSLTVQLLLAEAQAEVRFRKSLTNTYSALAYEVLSVRKLHPPQELVERNR